MVLFSSMSWARSWRMLAPLVAATRHLTRKLLLEEGQHVLARRKQTRGDGQAPVLCMLSKARCWAQQAVL